MINNPDGTRRLPTKEEILENARKLRNSTANGNGSETIRRPTQAIDAENRRHDLERPGTAQYLEGTKQHYQGGNGLDESQGGSTGRSNGELRRPFRPFGGNDRGIDEHIERSTTGSQSTATSATNNDQPTARVIPLRKASKFAPYREAIKASFTDRQKKKKEETPKRAYKVLTAQEALLLREKLVQVILWQCDHADEFISATTRGHKSVTIWSDIDTKEAGLLADYLISRAKVNARVAHIVRQLADIRDRIQLLLITVPRAYRTIMTYLERGISIR